MRPLQRPDWQRLKEIRLHALRTEPGVFFSAYGPEAAAGDEHWQSLIEPDEGRCIFGAFDGDELVGITGVFTDRNDPSGTTAALGMTYLLPAYRGRGLSALYFDTRVRWARARPQFVRIAVSHRRSNEASGRAIERYGFARTGTVGRTWPDGAVEDEVTYELTLAPAAEVTLVSLRDEDFAEMLRGAAYVRPGLAAPPGGVDDPVVVSHVQRVVTQQRASHHDAGNWMIIAGGEVVGLGGFKGPASADGEIEIGYSIAASRRRRGHMTRAVALILEVARRDPAIRTVLADTAVDNVASQRVLAKNGFERFGTRDDPVDGALVRWRKRL